MQRQVDRLLEEVSKREGIRKSEIVVVKECASSFKERKGLNDLVDSMIDGKVKKVYCEYQDRLSRVPSLTSMVNHIAERYSVQVVCLDKEETDPDSLAAQTQELMDYVCVLNNRASARKAALITTKKVSSDAWELMVKLRRKGMGLLGIEKALAKKGFTTENGGDPITYHLIRKKLAKVSKSLNIRHPKEVVGEFRRECLVNSLGNELRIDPLWVAYTGFCEGRGLETIDKKWFGRYLAQQVKTTTRGGRRTFFHDVEVKR